MVVVTVAIVCFFIISLFSGFQKTFTEKEGIAPADPLTFHLISPLIWNWLENKSRENVIALLPLYILIFMQSIRESSVDLYLSPLPSLIKKLFALEHSNYASWLASILFIWFKWLLKLFRNPEKNFKILLMIMFTDKIMLYWKVLIEWHTF